MDIIGYPFYSNFILWLLISCWLGELRGQQAWVGPDVDEIYRADGLVIFSWGTESNKCRTIKISLFFFMRLHVEHKNTSSCIENECCIPRTVNLAYINFTPKISIPPEPVFKGVRVPLRSRHILSQKRWHFHKNTRSCIENEWCGPHTVNISNVNFT